MKWLNEYLKKKRYVEEISVEKIRNYIVKLINLCEGIQIHIEKILEKRRSLTEDFLMAYSEKIRDPVYFREITSLEFVNLKREEDDISKLLVLEGLLENDLMKLSSQFEIDVRRFQSWRGYILGIYFNPTPEQSEHIIPIRVSLSDLASEHGRFDEVLREIGTCLHYEKETEKLEKEITSLLGYKNVVKTLNANRIKKWEAKRKMEVEQLKEHLEHENDSIDKIRALLNDLIGDFVILRNLTEGLLSSGPPVPERAPVAAPAGKGIRINLIGNLTKEQRKEMSAEGKRVLSARRPQKLTVRIVKPNPNDINDPSRILRIGEFVDDLEAIAEGPGSESLTDDKFVWIFGGIVNGKWVGHIIHIGRRGPHHTDGRSIQIPSTFEPQENARLIVGIYNTPEDIKKHNHLAESLFINVRLVEGTPDDLSDILTNETVFFRRLFSELRNESFDEAERLISAAILKLTTPQRILDVNELAFLRGLVAVQIKNGRFDEAGARFNSENISQFNFPPGVIDELKKIVEELRASHPERASQPARERQAPREPISTQERTDALPRTGRGQPEIAITSPEAGESPRVFDSLALEAEARNMDMSEGVRYQWIAVNRNNPKEFKILKTETTTSNVIRDVVAPYSKGCSTGEYAIYISLTDRNLRSEYVFVNFID